VNLRVKGGYVVTVSWKELKLLGKCNCLQNTEHGTCAHAIGVLAADPSVITYDEDVTKFDQLTHWVALTSFDETWSDYRKARKKQEEYTAMANMLRGMLDRCMAQGWPPHGEVPQKEPDVGEVQQTKAM